MMRRRRRAKEGHAEEDDEEKGGGPPGGRRGEELDIADAMEIIQLPLSNSPPWLDCGSKAAWMG